MLFTTTTQYIALAVALVAGWLFGLASHPGGRKWKARYVAERDAHAVTSKRVSELERDHDTATKRTAELERDHGHRRDTRHGAGARARPRQRACRGVEARE